MKKLLLTTALLSASAVSSAYDISGLDITLGDLRLNGDFDQGLIYNDADNDGTITVEDGEVSLGGYGFISTLQVGADTRAPFACSAFSSGECEIVFSYGGLVLESIDTTAGNTLGFDVGDAYFNFYLLDAASSGQTIDQIFTTDFNLATQGDIQNGSLYVESVYAEDFFTTQRSGTSTNDAEQARTALDVFSHAGAGWYFDTNQFGDAEPYDIQVSSSINQNSVGEPDTTVVFNGVSIDLSTFSSGTVTIDAVVSEPGALAIMGSLLLGAGFVTRRRKS